MLSPKQKRNISRIIPFGIIWLVTGWVLLLAETVATGNQNLNPDSAVTVTLPVFIFASLAITAVGVVFQMPWWGYTVAICGAVVLLYVGGKLSRRQESNH